MKKKFNVLGQHICTALLFEKKTMENLLLEAEGDRRGAARLLAFLLKVQLKVCLHQNCPKRGGGG